MGCKVEVLAYIGNHANCTTSEVNRAVRCDQNCVDWVLTRAEIDELVAEGKKGRQNILILPVSVLKMRYHRGCCFSFIKL